MNVRVSIVVMATAALLVAAVPAGADPYPVSFVSNAGALSDLSPLTADVTDGARAAALAVSREGSGMIVLLGLRGLDRTHAGMTYGAHVHVGPCVAGVGAAAGPHYNSTGNPAVVIDPTTEVWLDFTVRASGTGLAVARVPFVVPSGGAGSIVIHAMSTSPTGTAGARLACLPMAF